MGIFSKLIGNVKAASNPFSKEFKTSANYDPFNVFTAPDLPEVTPAPPSPTDADPAVAEAERKAREAQLRARGLSSTIATSGAGDTSKPSLARRFLLGS